MNRLDEITEGQSLPVLEKHPTRPQLFRYSAITWNPHRIHYDPEYARTEGHPDVLVQAHLHGAFIQELLMDWLGTDGLLKKLSWRNIGRAVPDEALYVEASVTGVDREQHAVQLDVWTRTDEERCAEGQATVQFST